MKNLKLNLVVKYWPLPLHSEKVEGMKEGVVDEIERGY